MMQKQTVLVVALVGIVSTVSGVAGQRRAADDGWCRQERNGDREQACEVREYTVPVGAAQLSLDAAPNGGIEVKGATRGDILIQAKVTTWADTAQRAGELLRAIRVNAASDKVSADGPRTDRRESWSVSYRLAVPSQMSLDLRTVNGGISLENVDGRLEFTTVNGGVKLTDVSGSVRGRTSNGGVEVDLEGATWQGEGLDVETNNGGIRLRVPEQYSARLEAGTVNGGINVDLPITVPGRIDREIATNLGGGGPLLRLRTHNGGVRVTKK
ncbi:MAG: hypothetical protein ABIX28_11065 [Vicinamibacterales bacterium]